MPSRPLLRRPPFRFFVVHRSCRVLDTCTCICLSEPEHRMSAFFVCTCVVVQAIYRLPTAILPVGTQRSYRLHVRFQRSVLQESAGYWALRPALAVFPLFFPTVPPLARPLHEHFVELSHILLVDQRLQSPVDRFSALFFFVFLPHGAFLPLSLLVFRVSSSDSPHTTSPQPTTGRPFSFCHLLFRNCNIFGYFLPSSFWNSLNETSSSSFLHHRLAFASLSLFRPHTTPPSEFR